MLTLIISDFSSMLETTEICKILGLSSEGQLSEVIEDSGEIVLDRTCFYAESGGQIADGGLLESPVRKKSSRIII